jgi:hypothetical protein
MSTLTDEDCATQKPNRGLFWALLPVGLLVASLSGLLVMASIARRDPSFALEADYYERAVRWDRQQVQWATNERLGYRVAALAEDGPNGVELEVVVNDRAGRSLTDATVTAEAFANARAAEVRRLAFQAGTGGIHRVSLGHVRPGLWEFRFVVTRNGERFTEIVRKDLPGRFGRP